MSDFSPIKLSPAFKDYIWGGSKLKTLYNKNFDLTPLAESWELSTHKDGESVISGGKYDSLSFSEYLECVGNKVIGKKAECSDRFPLLIKFIDASDNLSVQVHPDDEYALLHEGEYGKTEMWYVLDCEKDAYIYYGFSKDITQEEYKTAIESNTLTDLLNKVYVHPGDVFLIPAGTVHAICKGIIICEIQQNSNITYRVYDYGRKDKSGNTRPLHIEKALEVSNLNATLYKETSFQGDDVLLAQCKYFTVHRLIVNDNAKYTTDTDSFTSLIVTEGSGLLSMNNEEIHFSKGDSIFIPAQKSSFTICGKCEIILSRI